MLLATELASRLRSPPWFATATRRWQSSMLCSGVATRLLRPAPSLNAIDRMAVAFALRHQTSNGPTLSADEADFIVAGEAQWHVPTLAAQVRAERWFEKTKRSAQEAARELHEARAEFQAPSAVAAGPRF